MLTRKQSKILTTLLTLFIAALFSIHKGDPALIGINTPASNSPTSATSSYRVTHVVDGDTVDIERDGVTIRVRLLGINSPESVDPRRPVECFGKEASRYAKNILDNQEVLLVTDPSQGMLDKYGRTLAYVFLLDARNFNQQMIAEGYAYEYTYNKPYRYQYAFKQAEYATQREEKGLWASTTCSGMK